MEILELMRRELEPLAFNVKNELLLPQRMNTMERESFSFGSLLRSQLERLSHSFISTWGWKWEWEMLSSLCIVCVFGWVVTVFLYISEICEMQPAFFFPSPIGLFYLFENLWIFLLLTIGGEKGIWWFWRKWDIAWFYSDFF